MCVSCAVDLFYSKEDPLMAGRSGAERKIAEIGLGFARLQAVSRYVKGGAPRALAVENSFSLNYDIDFDADGLLYFLKECFADVLATERGQAIVAGLQPGRRYTVKSFDMS